MKTALLILLILAGGAGIYYSYEQQEEFKTVIAKRIELEREDAKRVGVLRETEEKRHAAEQERDSWVKTQGEKQALADNEKDKNDALLKELEGISTNLLAKQTQYQQIQDELAKYNFSDPQEVIDRKDAAEAKNKELLASNEEMNVLVDGVSKKVASLESELGEFQKRQAEYRAKLAANGREYQIVAVDPQWGFVVVNAGEDNHLTPQSTLMVTRDGKTVAKLKITSLEKRQTVADIVEGSLSQGNRLEVGDSVILVKPQG